jgi:hypothetical protein
MILAAIQSAPADPLIGLRDNASVVSVPWPAWVWWCIGVGVVVIVALLIWLGTWLAKRKPKTVPPTARQIALRALDDLHARADKTEPYEFSVIVSDVLRTYIAGQFGLRATQQTSPEFLNSIASAPEFTSEDRQLLAVFLDRCDLLKFARIEARSEENKELLRAAAAFVQGTRTEQGAHA